MGNGINNSSCMALLSSYEEKRQDYISYFEISGALGCLVGPLLGSLLYYFFGFQGPFFGLGFSQLIMVIIFHNKKRNIPLREDFIKKQ